MEERQQGSSPKAGGRFQILDAVKGIAACVIVGHHLSEFSPSAHLAHQFAPSLMYAIYNYGLFAVHIFFVFGGFALAIATSEKPISWRQACSSFVVRYMRLVVPYLVMLLLLITVSWSRITSGMNPPLIDSFSWWQFLAHVFFLQDVFGFGNLSAGTWYLCIDIQYVGLYLLMQAVLHSVGKIVKKDLSNPIMMATFLVPLGMISIWYWSRNQANDTFVFFFLGPIVLGTLVAWQWKRMIPSWVLLFYTVGMVSSLAIEFRPRLLVALGAALILYVVVRNGRDPQVPRSLLWLGRISYCLFLIHYLVNGLVLHSVNDWIGESPFRAFTAMIGAFLISILAARALHLGVEVPCHRWINSFGAASRTFHVRGKN